MLCLDTRLCSDCGEPIPSSDPFATRHAGCCSHPHVQVETAALPGYCGDCGSDLIPSFDDDTGQMVGWEAM
jgi:hypothetical protein